jgi:hypothetical protein
MNRLYVPSLGPTDWRRLLADPVKQWKPRHSALELAVSWESVRKTDRGLPPSVQAALDRVDDLRGAELVIGLPEHVVDFEGGGHGSQNDLWALLRVGSRYVSMTIEAKAGETFDEIVSIWLQKASSERSKKASRLKVLQHILGIDDVDVSSVRYQLLHRTASALLEAKRFTAQCAVMLVQSFNDEADRESLKDFLAFASIMKTAPEMGQIVKVGRHTEVPLYIGWSPTPQATMDTLSAAI